MLHMFWVIYPTAERCASPCCLWCGRFSTSYSFVLEHKGFMWIWNSQRGKLYHLSTHFKSIWDYVSSCEEKSDADICTTALRQKNWPGCGNGERGGIRLCVWGWDRLTGNCEEKFCCLSEVECRASNKRHTRPSSRCITQWCSWNKPDGLGRSCSICDCIACYLGLGLDKKTNKQFFRLSPQHEV